MHQEVLQGSFADLNPGAIEPIGCSPSAWTSVDDADAAVEGVKKSGGRLVGEIMDIPNVGRYARVQDTEGNVIGLIKPTMS